MSLLQSQSSSLLQQNRLLQVYNTTTTTLVVDSPHLRHSHHHHINNKSNGTTSQEGNFSSWTNGSNFNNNYTNLGGSTGIKLNDIIGKSTSETILNGFTAKSASLVDIHENGMNDRLDLPFNLSLAEIEEMNSFQNLTLLDPTVVPTTITQNMTSNPVQIYLSSVYSIIVPLMIFFCVLTCLVNLIIVLSARWCRKPMSPTLYFSISLALADAYASFILGTGLVINSFLPKVYEIKLSTCVSLTIEAFRNGGILVTVCHLLALGINHWIGIVRPLHYAATMTRRTAWIVIILSWICPILMIFIYYSSVGGEGFLSEDCENWNFLKKRAYRGFFASCFFAPLLLMSLIYLHIFMIVRNHHLHRLRYQSSHQLRRNVKAVLTTVLILGTYIIGWMPAIIYNIIVCDDCLIKLDSVPLMVKVSIGITVNTLVIFKTLVDPIIYAARMSDIQLSLKKMKYDFLHIFCKSCVHAVPPADADRGYISSTTRTLSKFNRSLYESKSVRMSNSGGSAASSTRRAAAANLMNNASTAGHSHQNNYNGNGNGTTTTAGGNGCGGFNNSITYKHHNGNGSTSNNYNNQSSNSKSQLLQKKSAFEMTEMH